MGVVSCQMGVVSMGVVSVVSMGVVSCQMGVVGMGVVRHSYGGFGGGTDAGGGWYARGTKPINCWSHVRRYGSVSRVRGYTLLTTDLTSIQVRISG